MAMKTDLRAKFFGAPHWKHQFVLYIYVCVERLLLFLGVFFKYALLCPIT